jgi:hypothetical protein
MISLDTDTEDGHSARAAYEAAFCLDATVMAIFALKHRLEATVGWAAAKLNTTVHLLDAVIDQISDRSTQVARQYSGLTGREHPVGKEY